MALGEARGALGGSNWMKLMLRTHFRCSRCLEMTSNGQLRPVKNQLKSVKKHVSSYIFQHDDAKNLIFCRIFGTSAANAHFARARGHGQEAKMQWAKTPHFKPFRAIGSVRNEFAASISSRLSPPRPPGPPMHSPRVGIQKNWVTQFLRYQFLSIQDCTTNIGQISLILS